MKCKECDCFGCERRGKGETECFYEIEMRNQKEAEEAPYWRKFRAEAAKDILCAIISRNPAKYLASIDFVVDQSVIAAGRLIESLNEKEKEEK